MSFSWLFFAAAVNSRLMASQTQLFILAGLFGACIGSFLNVVICRLPLGESVVTPRSRCPYCQYAIAWYDNIPVLSFLLLAGKCRHCRGRIDLQYPLVELVATFLALATFAHVKLVTPFLLYYCLFMAPLIAVIFIDLRHQIIPNIISLSGIPIGLIVSLFLAHPLMRQSVLIDRVAGIFVGGGFLFCVGTLYEKIKHREGLGGGDVKLAALFGAFFGWQAVVFILLLSSVLGSIVGVLFILFLKRNWQFAIPFGPFLAFSAYLYFFFGPPILNWYLSLF